MYKISYLTEAVQINQSLFFGKFSEMIISNNTGARQGGSSLPVSAHARTLNPLQQRTGSTRTSLGQILENVTRPEFTR